MGVEVKGAGDGVVIADRGCNDDCCCGNRSSQPSGRCSKRPEHYQSSCGCLKRYNYTGSVIFNLLG